MKALFLALLFAAQQPDDVAQRIDAATHLVDAGKIDEGIAALTKIVADHPENETAKYELALAYMGKGDAENCRRLAEPLAETATENRLRVISVLGNCLDELGQHDKAIAAYRRGLALAPTDWGLNFNLAITLARQGKLDEARELLKTDTRANPWHSSGHLVLATIFEQQNFRVPAVMSYLHFLALEQSPRASNAAARLQRLLNLGVETKGKETKIAFDPNSPKEEGDYGPMAMALALVSAGRSLAEKEKLSEFEKARDQIAFVITLFLDQTDKHDDYTATVQRPFFAAMQKEKLIDTFAAIAAAPLKLNGTAPPADLQRYQQWIAPQQRRPAVQAK
ncbi:MAG TPA: tetratricopeptide repeat protein [Thermoanaerobaculia bacterium]|nr:tetratricopeptide repeat protein [Thermoanaerobaculia bacterium]